MARIMNVAMLSVKPSDLADVANGIFNVIYDKLHVVEGFTSGDSGEILHHICTGLYSDFFIFTLESPINML